MNTKRNRQRGKRTERAIAKRIGGKRTGVLGKEDVAHEKYSIECKSRKVFVGEKWLQQAEKNAEGGKIPIVIVHILNKSHGNDIVMIRLKDFLKEKQYDQRRSRKNIKNNGVG